jgi:hypothetical protein
VRAFQRAVHTVGKSPGPRTGLQRSKQLTRYTHLRTNDTFRTPDSHPLRVERHHLWSLAGFAVALVLLLALAEVYLRWWPPSDLHPFLGDEAPLAGPFAAHPHFGITNRSFADFQQDYQ